MALALNDRVKETTIVTGTGIATLLGSSIGFQPFSVVGNGNTTYYCIADQFGSNWEVGIGTYTASGNTLARTTVLASSNAGALVVFTAGIKDVFVTYPSSKGLWKDASGNAIGLGTPAAFVGTNITGTASGLTAGNVTTNANLTGAVTSVGNAASLGSFTSLQLATALTNETGTGSAVFSDNASLLNPTYTGTLTGSTGVVAIGTNQIYKDASGNVGIGTTLPVTSLTVQAGSGTGIKVYDASAGTGGTWGCIESIGSRGDGNGSFGGRFGAGSRRTDGTAIATGWALGTCAFGGQWGTGTTYNQTNFLYTAAVVGVSEGSFTSATAMPTALVFRTGSTGSSLQSINVDYGTERMRISSTGIVTMSAYGVGTATFSAAGVISSVSDETWKIKDGVPVDADSMLKNLEPGYWYYNDEKAPIFGTDRQLGFYAQNVNAAIGPEAAPAPEEGKPWGYYDRSVLAVTVLSLQKALATIEELTARLTKAGL
jgi:hypothetical protein